MIQMCEAPSGYSGYTSGYTGSRDAVTKLELGAVLDVPLLLFNGVCVCLLTTCVYRVSRTAVRAFNPTTQHIHTIQHSQTLRTPSRAWCRVAMLMQAFNCAVCSFRGSLVSATAVEVSHQQACSDAGSTQ